MTAAYFEDHPTDPDKVILRKPKHDFGGQEPVAWISAAELMVMRGNALGGAKDWRINVGLVKQDGDVGLYTTPPQRKPLTDEEIILIVAECAASHQHTDIHFARAIERAHGIKELV